jgi:Tol biopolymer transport system component
MFLEDQVRNATLPIRGTIFALLSLTIAHFSLAVEPARLTDDGWLMFSPTFEPDGKAIVYVELEKPTLLRLMRLDLATKKAAPLHAEAKSSEFEPAWSRQGPLYAFARLKGPLSVCVCIRNQQTGAEVEIPPGEGFSGLRSPAVSDDGKRVAYNFPDGGGQRLISIASDGSDRRELADASSFNNWPDFSPDGKQLVFSSTRDGNYEVYVMPADGGAARRLTDSPFQDIRPRYSHNGKRIAFTSHRDGNAELYVMDSDGGNVQRLTDHAERDDYPAWHPDGQLVAAICERGGKHDLYLVSTRTPTPISDDE